MNVAAQKQCNCSPPHLHTEELLNGRPGERPPLRNHLGTIRCGKNDHFELTNYPPRFRINRLPLDNTEFLFCAGAEAARQGFEVPGSREEEQGELRARPPGHHQLQFKVWSSLKGLPTTILLPK